MHQCNIGENSVMMKGNELLNKHRENVCVCVVEREVSQKAGFVLLRILSAVNESTCQKWSMCWALGAGENRIFCTYRFRWTPSYNDDKHSTFALLKLQLNRIVTQPNSLTDVSVRTALNLNLVGKLWVICFWCGCEQRWWIEGNMTECAIEIRAKQTERVFLIYF